MAGSTVGCCGQLVVGWRRHEAPFMKRVAHSAPPRLPPPPAPSSRRTAPCGALLVPLHSLCSGCLASVPMGVLLADGEALCEVCVCATFDLVEQRAAAPPRLALFARREEIELLRAQLPPRDFALLHAVRAGDELRCCECIPRLDVRGRACAFVGFCLRRRVAVVRLGESLAALPLPLLRRGAEEARAQEAAAMLRALMAFGACTLTLQRAVAEVRASHALCGAGVLAEAERRAARLQEQQVEALEGWKPYALGAQPAHNCCVRPGEVATSGKCAVPRNG